MVNEALSGLTFRDVRPGMTVRILGVSGDTPELRRLQELGLTPGTVFQVVRVAPLGDPVEIALRGYRLCLRRSEASAFLLESLNDPLTA
ncbi:MAG: ferrous iron transport protein A [Armatimonadetes bacterium]|nr:MAG: ferrous iron transport protein A [Armatimonadota bacterium]